MRHVISAVEKIIDKHLPVAMNVVDVRGEVMQLAHAERSNSLHQPAKKITQRNRFRVEIHEHELFPSLSLHRDQAILLALKILYAVELRHSFQRTIQSIVPTVIRTMQNGSLSARFSNHGGRVVTAHIVEAPQYTIVPADDDDRLSGDTGGDELAGLLNLLTPPYQLPRLAEDCVVFELSNARIHIPGRRDGRCLREVRVRVVSVENALDCALRDHG